MKNTHDSRGDCVFRPVQEVSAAAFRPFLVSVWFHVNRFEREEPAWFHRRADTPQSPWTGPNQPENVDNVGSAWLQGDKHTGDLNQRAEADRCVASLQTGRCSAARRHDPNSNSTFPLILMQRGSLPFRPPQISCSLLTLGDLVMV